MKIKQILSVFEPGLLVLLLAVFGALLCKGQSNSGTGTLNINVFPTSAIVRLDTMLIENTKSSLALEPGVYTLKVWAPSKEFVETQIKITEDSITSFILALKPSPEYTAYRNEFNTYRKKRVRNGVLIATPIVLATAIGTLAAVRLNAISNDLQLVELSIEREATAHYGAISIQELQNTKAAFEAAKEDHHKLRKQHRNTLLYSSIGIGLSSAWTIITVIKTKKPDKPSFTEEPKLVHNTVKFDLQFGLNQAGISVVF